MRAITTALTKLPAASACESDASSFTRTGPMFISAKADSDAISSMPSALPTSENDASGPSSRSGFCTIRAMGTAMSPAMPTATPNGPAVLTPMRSSSTAPSNRTKPSAPMYAL